MDVNNRYRIAQKKKTIKHIQLASNEHTAKNIIFAKMNEQDFLI